MKSTLSNGTESEWCNLHTKQWYAIYVRSRQEKKVHQIFLKNGMESSLPLKKIIKIWSDRKKRVEMPLFKGYVFVRIDIAKDKLNILKTDGVVKFIGIQGTPSRILNREIHWIHRIVEESNAVQNEKEIPIGLKVRVMAGPFKGIEGIVMRSGNQSRLVLHMETIMHAVSIEINQNYLENINN